MPTYLTYIHGHTYIHTYIHTYTHAHTYTHTQKNAVTALLVKSPDLPGSLNPSPDSRKRKREDECLKGTRQSPQQPKRPQRNQKRPL